MEPVSKAKGTYQNPPDGQIPDWKCPHCGTNLEHFKTSERVVAVPETKAEKPLDVKTLEAVAEGDLFVQNVPPQVVREFEQVQTGQARPEKRDTHVIPGMTPKPKPAPKPPAPQPDRNNHLSVLDNPIIGGKVTICVLLYGQEHYALHRRCLTSICETVPPSRMDLRVACNQVGLETTNYLRSLPITKIYEDFKNRRKYPAMREMFWDDSCRIDTNYVVWFDDDSYVLNPQWLGVLGQVITAQRPKDRVGCYGHKMIHPLNSRPSTGDPRQWFRNADWFRGKSFQDKQGRDSPNGMMVHFPVGGFWCISTEAIRSCNIPDTRLNHNGGDVCIGEQLHQNGFKTKMFNEKKQYIKTSGAPRRGFTEKFLWHR